MNFSSVGFSTSGYKPTFRANGFLPKQVKNTIPQDLLIELLEGIKGCNRPKPDTSKIYELIFSGKLDQYAHEVIRKLDGYINPKSSFVESNNAFKNAIETLARRINDNIF